MNIVKSWIGMDRGKESTVGSKLYLGCRRIQIGTHLILRNVVSCISEGRLLWNILRGRHRWPWNLRHLSIRIKMRLRLRHYLQRLQM
jgi:hypothetical protein